MNPEAHDQPNSNDAPAEPSVGALIGAIADDFGVLLRAEIKLAETEIKGNLAAFVPAALMLAAAALLVVVALILLCFGLAWLLHPYLGAGWSELFVAFAILLTAFVAIRTGLARMRNIELMPQRAGKALRRSPDALRGRA